jgi:CarD family transcriptional regulator
MKENEKTEDTKTPKAKSRSKPAQQAKAEAKDESAAVKSGGAEDAEADGAAAKDAEKTTQPPAKSKRAAAFKISQKVVYPSQGVGKIVEILDKKFNDQTLAYYKIYLEVTDMVIMVPVDKVADLGIRAIVKPAEAQAALDMIGENIEPVTTDWKLRYQMNLDLLKKGTVADIATIVRSLYHRSKVKELPVLERKLYDSAKKLLEDEISYALNLPAKEVEAAIHAKLEPAGMLHVAKPHAADEEFLDDDFPDDVESDNDDDLDDDEYIGDSADEE